MNRIGGRWRAGQVVVVRSAMGWFARAAACCRVLPRAAVGWAGVAGCAGLRWAALGWWGCAGLGLAAGQLPPRAPPKISCKAGR